LDQATVSVRTLRLWVSKASVTPKFSPFEELPNTPPPPTPGLETVPTLDSCISLLSVSQCDAIYSSFIPCSGRWYPAEHFKILFRILKSAALKETIWPLKVSSTLPLHHPVSPRAVCIAKNFPAEISQEYVVKIFVSQYIRNLLQI